MSSAACDCCSGVTDRTPVLVDDRPGLSAIPYRVGTHPEFLASMLAGLTDAQRPALAQLASRDRGDFTPALLDAWAVVSDVLTFYTERLAQESYLRTARERVSLQELGRLIGYRMRPGVAAETQLAFSIQAPPNLPAATMREPGSAPPVTPAVVTLETGLRVQSIPGPGEQPQTFETVEAIDARPEWNAIPASPNLASMPGKGASGAWLQGAALNLKPGDALLLAGTAADVLPEHWDLRILTEVAVDAAHARTRVAWDEPLGSVSPAGFPANPALPHVMRRRLDVFGHNAPALNSAGGAWTGFTISPEGADHVDVEGSHPDVTKGGWVVLARHASRELWAVGSVSELSRAAFNISGKATRLGLVGGENYDWFDDSPRETKVFAVSEPLALADVPDETDVGGGALRVDVDVTAMAPGRRIVVRGTTTGGVDHAEAAIVKSIGPAGPGRWTITLEQGLTATYVRDTVVVHGNVATATHGETVQQVLGAGRANAAFQRFTLAHAPLTHLRSTDPSGASAALEVRVNDVRWDEQPTLYGARPGDRSYVVRTDEQDRTYVRFGDGAAGARLPSGSNNVRARYRKGLGAAGNVGAGGLAQLIDRPLGAKGVSNPSAATGGVDPENATAARASIPLAVRTLGRAVSLLDYEDYARAYAGVAKAHAAVLSLRAGRTVVVTVAFTDAGTGPADPGRLDELAASLRSHGDPHVQLEVVAHRETTFRLGLKVAADPAYEAEPVLGAVEAALRGAYAFDARGFGEPVERSKVVAAAHSVAGVVAVDIDLLYLAGAGAGLADRLAALQPAVAAGGGALGAGLLLLDPAPLDELTVMT
ncbi:MAG: hypothetical protein QOI64_704 [Solirubrobacteraceae bacterium]|nr:hypothetical protein [Solirubrobacteraceae bacterium]